MMNSFKKNIYKQEVNDLPPPPPPSYYAWQFSSPGRDSSSLACAQTSFPLTLFTAENVLDYGVEMYIDSDLTTLVGSGNLWYQLGVDGISYRIDNSGLIAEITTCSI